MECRSYLYQQRVQAGGTNVGLRQEQGSQPLPWVSAARGFPFRPHILLPPANPGAAYRAIGRAGAHFVPLGIPADLEDAASASVAVDEPPTLQSKAAVRS